MKKATLRTVSMIDYVKKDAHVNAHPCKHVKQMQTMVPSAEEEGWQGGQRGVQGVLKVCSGYFYFLKIFYSILFFKF